MEVITNIIKSEIFLVVVASMNLLLLILYICNLIKLKKINKNYEKFMKKIGNGNNIDEMLKNYIDRVEEINKKDNEIIKYCNELEKEISLCIKKIGIIRYSAFKDTGSDLSFAVALLNDNNDGVLLNGIYSREMSNIYAKQIIDGKANTKLSEEEREALEKALNQ